MHIPLMPPTKDPTMMNVMAEDHRLGKLCSST